MTFPSRLTFWRVVLAVSAILASLSLWQMLGVAQRLGIAVQSSKTWLGLLGGLAFLGSIGLLGAVLTFIPGWKAWFERFDLLSRVNDRLHWLAGVLLIVFLLAYPAMIAHPYYGGLIGKEEAVRLLLFWLFGLWGAGMLRVLWKKADWPAAFGVVLLLQAVIHLVTAYLAGITDYPFALGWSETSRFYYPALFLSENIFGRRYPWPILHPSLHLALVPPYLFDAPLWLHRAWQIGLRFLLVGLIAPALLARLKLETPSLRWVVGVWIFLYLFDLPLYLHLAVPVFIMLWGFSARNDRRTWIALVLASIWAGLSRLNWYPMPGMLAAALYLLECPLSQQERAGVREGFRYLLKPALWVLAGSGIAFATMRLYIVLSGLSNVSDFYTSLTSSLLWYRLWPNASYDLGVLPGITLFSLPVWAVLGAVFARRELHPLRVGLLLLGLAVLFVGGIFVSMKIGGGADIHNMDAYAVTLFIVGAYLFFGRYTPEPDEKAPLPNFHWVFLALLVLMPVWFGQRPSFGFVTYDKAATQAALTVLQHQVDSVNASGSEILFITQRHLISMGMLKDVTLIPEYEREELMEMAMADNQGYLDRFKAEVQQHRFAVIVVDPLAINLLGSNYAMGEENNAWVRYVAKSVLCNYQLAQIFPDDHIAIYVPQDGMPACQ